MKYTILSVLILLFSFSCDNNDYIDYSNQSTDCSNPLNDTQDDTGLCCPSSELDCNGLCFGTGELDDCNVCDGNNSCYGCMDSNASNYDELASIDNNLCCYDDNWCLTWEDNFNLDILDESKWEYQLGDGSQYGIVGWGNNELQYYTNELSNIGISGCDNNNESCLYIRSYKQDYLGSDYTSSRIKSKQFQTYGKIEIRAKLPIANGTWPALWMLPEEPTVGWPASGEIDIMEHIGCDSGLVHGSIHCTAYNHNDGTEQTGNSFIQNVEGFHIYTIEWDENYIKWFIDDIEYFVYEPLNLNQDNWPFNQNFHVILNLAIGGDWGSLGGTCPIDYNAFPQSMLIDYVRFFEKIN